jgi:hypothetical protein
MKETENEKEARRKDRYTIYREEQKNISGGEWKKQF